MHRRRRPERHRRVDIVHAQPAGPRLRIGNTRLHAHPVADLEVRHALADFDHRSRRLVPQHHRCVDHERTDPAMGVIVHVRAAHAHRMDRDSDHPRSDLERQVDIPHGELMLAFENKGAHLCHDLVLCEASAEHYRADRRSGSLPANERHQQRMQPVTSP